MNDIKLTRWLSLALLCLLPALPVKGFTFLWGAEVPYLYSFEDEAWYFIVADQNSSYAINLNTNEAVLLSAPSGNAPQSMEGLTLTVAIEGETGSITLAFGASTVVVTEGGVTEPPENYRYYKTGFNTGYLTISDTGEPFGIAVLDVNFSSPTAGTLNGMRTELGEHEVLAGTFQVAN